MAVAGMSATAAAAALFVFRELGDHGFFSGCHCPDFFRASTTSGGM